MYALVVLCLMAATAQAFTLIGPQNPVTTSAGRLAVGAGGGNVPGANFVDPMGFAVRNKEFYRLSYPELTYAFDSSFVRYFGLNGMRAVSNAVRVLNDFFQPEDGVYDGMSSMDLITEYDHHYSTWEFNASANLANVTDMQTLVLGLLVNQLGLGNPHRYCFVLQDVTSYIAPAAGAPGSGNFQVGIRNYDPYTYQATPRINGVEHGYWLWNDAQIQLNAIPTTWDAMEYHVGSDEAYTAVAGIRDVINFGGLAWPGPAPTVFRTPGVFFAPDNQIDAPPQFLPKALGASNCWWSTK